MIDYSNIPRDSRRVPIEARVQFTFDRFAGFLSEYSSNISPGGMFIKTLTPLALGQILDFEFDLGDGFELIKGRGEVVWTRIQDEGPLRPPGMGLRFQELSEGSRDLIYRMVDQHVLQGGTPFDVSQIPHDPPPPLEQEPLPPLDLLPPVPDPDATDASSWLPALDLGASPAAPASAAPQPVASAPAPSFAPVFGSAAARQPRNVLPWVVAGAVALALVAAGFLFKDRLLELAGLGGEEVVAQAPAPSAPLSRDVPRRTAAPPAPAVEESPAAVGSEVSPEVGPEASPTPASPAPVPPPSASGPPLTRLEKITWEEAFGGTDIVLEGNGSIPESVYTRSRIEGNPPRELLRLSGIKSSFPSQRLRVGTADVLQVRTGYHPDKSEIHVVLDLAHPSVKVTRVEQGERSLRIHLQRE
jgi:uncharacterized protein (TIGR02266 family)